MINVFIRKSQSKLDQYAQFNQAFEELWEEPDVLSVDYKVIDESVVISPSYECTQPEECIHFAFKVNYFPSYEQKYIDMHNKLMHSYKKEGLIGNGSMTFKKYHIQQRMEDGISDVLVNT